MGDVSRRGKGGLASLVLGALGFTAANAPAGSTNIATAFSGDVDNPEYNTDYVGENRIASTATKQPVPGLTDQVVGQIDTSKPVAEETQKPEPIVDTVGGSSSTSVSTPTFSDIADIGDMIAGIKSLSKKPETAIVLKRQSELADTMQKNYISGAYDLFARAFGIGNGSEASRAMEENSKLRERFNQFQTGLDLAATKDPAKQRQGAIMLNEMMGGENVRKYNETLANLILQNNQLAMQKYQLKESAIKNGKGTFDSLIEQGKLIKELINSKQVERSRYQDLKNAGDDARIVKIDAALADLEIYADDVLKALNEKNKIK